MSRFIFLILTSLLINPSFIVSGKAIKEGFTYIECAPLCSRGSRVGFKAKFADEAKRIYSVKANYYNVEAVEDVYHGTFTSSNIIVNLIFSTDIVSDAYLEFKISSTEGQVLSLIYLPVKHATYDVLNTRDEFDFVPESKYSYYDQEQGIHYAREVISSQGIYENYDISEYPGFDFSYFRYGYGTPVPEYSFFPYEDAYFLISNIDGIFDDINENSNMNTYAIIYLKLNYCPEDNDYYLSFKEDHYVNPKDLKMSLTPKEGYIKTDILYIPVDYQKLASSFFASYAIRNIGFSYVTFNGQFKLEFDKPLFGSCQTSQYCINEVPSDSDFEMGEVFEH